jgi:hypothetical protein
MGLGDGLTSLTVIIPVGQRGAKIYLAQAGHERDLPEDCFYPRSGGLNIDVSALAIKRYRIERDAHLLRFETKGGKKIQVIGREIRASVLKP